VHAELRLGRGIVVGHGAVELLMRRAGLAGATGRPKWRRVRPDQIAVDLVDREFTRTGPNQLWVSDFERHEAFWNRAVVKGHRRGLVAASPRS
jgi:putative transposase